MPAYSSINTLAAFRDLLLSISELTALVSTRVYAINLAEGGKANFPCVLITRSPGGTDDEYVENEVDERYDVRCYGNSQPQADQVHRCVRTLHGQNGITVGNYKFDYLRQIQKFDATEQPTESEDWDCVFSMWEAHLCI